MNSCIEVSLIHGQRFEQNKCFSIDGQFAHISLMPCCADNLHTLIYRVPEYCSTGKPCCGDNPSGCQHRSAAVDHFQWENIQTHPSIRETQCCTMQVSAGVRNSTSRGQCSPSWCPFGHHLVTTGAVPETTDWNHCPARSPPSPCGYPMVHKPI